MLVNQIMLVLINQLDP